MCKAATQLWSLAAGAYQMTIVDGKNKEILPGSPFELDIAPAGPVAASSNASLGKGIMKGVVSAGEPVAVIVALAGNYQICPQMASIHVPC